MKFLKWYMSDVHACGYVRAEVVAREVNRHFRSWRMDCKTDVLLSDFYGTDVMVFQRQWSAGVLEKMRLAKTLGVRTVYELDDHMLGMPKEFQKPYEFYAKPDVRRGIEDFLLEADVLTCTTSTLAATLTSICGRTVAVVPNYLDAERWERVAAGRAEMEREEVVIGYMASGSHLIDAPMVMPALERLLREEPRVRLHFVGWVGFEQVPAGMQEFRDRIQVFPWVDIAELPYVMGNFDIGIAPLADNPFNRCKSGIKALQYWALGIPVVASKLNPYEGLVENGVDGYLVEGKKATADNADEADQWYGALRVLAKEPEVRRALGAAGRKKVLEQYDIRKRVGEWVGLWDRVAA